MTNRGSISGGVAPRFPHVVIVPYDAADRLARVAELRDCTDLLVRATRNAVRAPWSPLGAATQVNGDTTAGEQSPASRREDVIKKAVGVANLLDGPRETGVVIAAVWRNTRAGETGDPRENPLSCDIFRRDSHEKNPGVSPLVIEPDSPKWEESSLTTTPPRPPLKEGRVHVEIDGNSFPSLLFLVDSWCGVNEPLLRLHNRASRRASANQSLDASVERREHCTSDEHWF
ncbi:hypothetical protein PR048_002398 [Dryococelus australis]|uniref:Uncharacterized protein n=1 Tax=Dryococelus australis TaxID=614101 RepID=A0ABQ9IKS9_9NEOP|nr:hypothetical protein PR048_002398 [Dryococelus australis]